MSKTKSILILVILLASFIRFYQLSNIPPGFYCDEAGAGYNTYSLITTGKDMMGNLFPVFFKSIANDLQGGIYIYSMVPFIAVFGLNEFAVRATSAFWGILTVIILFLFVKQLYNEKIALLSSFFLAISPWHLQFSRIGFVAIIYPFFLVAGLWLFYKGLKETKYLYC